MRRLKKSKPLFKIAAVSASALFATWCINKLIFVRSSLKDHLSTDRDQIYPWRFGNIVYTKTGEGSPILLIHDLKSTASSNEWEGILARLAKNHTVYTIDLIGCGRSDKPKMTYTNYVYVQLVNDFIRNVIGRPTDVMTSGVSASIAVMGCTAESELYHRIVMVDPPSEQTLRKYPKANHKALKYLIECPIIGTFIYNVIFSRYFIKKEREHQVFDDEQVVERLTQAGYGAAHHGGPAVRYFYASERSHFTNINMFRMVGRLDKSMYLIFGESEPETEENMDHYLSINPAIEAEILPDCGHYPHLERPDAFMEICSIYLASEDDLDL